MFNHLKGGDTSTFWWGSGTSSVLRGGATSTVLWGWWHFMRVILLNFPWGGGGGVPRAIFLHILPNSLSNHDRETKLDAKNNIRLIGLYGAQ